MAISHRLMGNDSKARKELSILLDHDPLHHFANLEKATLSQSKKTGIRIFL